MSDLVRTKIDLALISAEQAEKMAVADGEKAYAKFLRAEIFRRARLIKEQAGQPVEIAKLQAELEAINNAIGHSSKLKPEDKKQLSQWKIEITKILALAHLKNNVVEMAAISFGELAKLCEECERFYEAAVAYFHAGLCYESLYRKDLSPDDGNKLILIKGNGYYNLAAGLFYKYAFQGEAAESYYRAGVTFELFAVDWRKEEMIGGGKKEYIDELFKQAMLIFNEAARLFRTSDSLEIAKKIQEMIRTHDRPENFSPPFESGEEQRVPVGISILGRTPKVPKVNHISQGELIAELKKAAQNGRSQKEAFERFMKEASLAIDERVAIENYLAVNGFNATLIALIGEEGVREVERSAKKPYGRRAGDLNSSPL